MSSRNVVASRDCPLLPGSDLQCPFAGPGHQCDIIANHPSFYGVSKVVFRGLTGHRHALRHLAKFNIDESNVVTVIWTDDQSAQEVDATRAVSALDPDGLVMPRLFGVFTIDNSEDAMRDDYMAILHNLQSLPLPVQRKWPIQYYESAIENEFASPDSPKAFTVMYQEYGGRPLNSLLLDMADAGFQGSAEEAREFQRRFARGYLELVGHRDEILRRNGVAHMDIHGDNVVVREPELQLRLIDLGFARNSAQDVIDAGLRTHDPLEYAMRQAAAAALDTTKNRKRCKELLQVGDPDEGIYQYGTDPAFPLIKLGDAKKIESQCSFVLAGTGVQWENLYAFVWSHAVEQHGRGRALEPMEEFQRGVYGSDEDYKMLWDDFGIAWTGLLAYNTLCPLLGAVEPEMEAMREKLQEKILQRFAGFEYDAVASNKDLYDVAGARQVEARRAQIANIYNVAASRDCPLLPNEELQCPHAPPGQMCDLQSSHPAFAGATKVVFRALTGHASIIKSVLQRRCDPRNVVTAIWQTDAGDMSAEAEVDMVKKIARADPHGKVFPRYWGHAVVFGAPASVLDDYLGILFRLERDRRDDRDENKKYRQMLHNQFLRGVSKDVKLVLLYQNYGGTTLWRYVTATLPALPTDELLRVQRALSRGFRDLVRRREATLCPAGIAHMDLHANNIVVDEHAHLRLIDFGFHDRPLKSLLRSAMEFHAPVEYAMLNSATQALVLVLHGDTSVPLLQLHDGQWGAVAPAHATGADPVVVKRDWATLEDRFGFVMRGTGVALEEVYALVWASVQGALLPGTTQVNVDLPRFQALLYGPSLRGMPTDVCSAETQCCLLWDDCEIAYEGIWVCNHIERAVKRRVGPDSVADDVHIVRHELQQTILRRFKTTDWAARVTMPVAAQPEEAAARVGVVQKLAGAVLTWLQPLRMKRKRSPLLSNV
jgi:tRNA A-37 threonylcarbamoyl transferase component Bud32